ncbi:MAG: hypothetical protein JHC21_03220 [Thermocrinis sp.]|nr:hypothetical protein [Thermocrinis sp.]
MRKLLKLLGLAQRNCLNCEKPAIREEFLCEDCLKELRSQHPMEYTHIPDYLRQPHLGYLYPAPDALFLKQPHKGIAPYGSSVQGL